MSFQLLSYTSVSKEDPKGAVHVDGRVYDLSDVLRSSSFATVVNALKVWDQVRPRLEQFVSDRAATALPYKQLSEVSLLAPVVHPGTIFCAGGNYNDHGGEMERVMKLTPVANLKERGQPPFFFIKNSSGVCGPNSITYVDSLDLNADWELELTAVIGRVARNVSEEEALDYVAGFTVGNDLSLRKNVRRQGLEPGEPFEYDWFRQKSFDGSCPLGPWITPTSQIPNVQDLKMKLWVGDDLMQDTSTSKMVFTVAEQVAELSRQLTLYPGDIVMTGTGSGVGMARGKFLHKGDVVRAWIEGVGEFAHHIG